MKKLALGIVLALETPFSLQPQVLAHWEVTMMKTLAVGFDLDLDHELELDLETQQLVLHHLNELALDLVQEYEGLDLVLG